MFDPNGIIKKLYRVFTTFFSMKDLENEFHENIHIEIFGNSQYAAGIHDVIHPKSAALLNDFNDTGAYSKIESSSISIFILDGQQVSTEIINDITYNILAHNRHKVLFCCRTDSDNIRITADSLLESLSIDKAVWFRNEPDLLKLIVKRLGKKAFPAARIYPGLREPLALSLMQKVSTENASIAFISSVPANIPVIGTIASLFAVAGETLIITANQLRLTLRIAGLYGHPLNFIDRISELWPVLAGALGWRTLARATVGLLPGAGPFIKASIAYGGTYVAGVGAEAFYRDGKLLNKKDLALLYAKSKDLFLKKYSKIRKRESKDDGANG